MRKQLIVKCVLFVAIALMAIAARADIMPSPTMGDLPLHRIGIEIVLETIAATAGGGALLRWLVNKGWKKDRELSRKERYLLKVRFENVLPEVKHDFAQWKKTVGADGTCNTVDLGTDTIDLVTRVDGNTRQVETIERFLRESPDTVRKLHGIPIEWVALALVKDWSPVSYWASRDDKEEYYAKIRRKWVSVSVRMQIRERRLQRIKWLLCIVLGIVLPVAAVIWLARILWQ